MAPSVEYCTGTKGAIDETRHEATEARHGRIEGDRGPEQAVGDLSPRDQLRQTGAGRGDAGQLCLLFFGGHLFFLIF